MVSYCNTFDKSLAVGKVGESQIAEWLKRRGNHILPVYEIEKGQYAGPAVYTSEGESVIAPDMLSFGGGKTTWVEAKYKEAFSWHRKTSCWVTGIDRRHYQEYLKIRELVDWPIWLLFLHRGGCAKDSVKSPAGLFGNDLEYLSEHINHEHENWGKTGMVYWAINSLKKLSDYPLDVKNA